MKDKYRVTFNNGKICETWAVSKKQAVNNAKFQLGLAGSYEYWEIKTIKIEKIEG